MNIKHLALFVRVATTHNITQAAESLGISPAVASSYLNKLEQELGTKLLDRTTRSVSLTTEGKAFLYHAEDVLSSVDTAKASVGKGAVVPSGTLHIAAPASFGRMHLISVINGFVELYPQLTVDLRLSDTRVSVMEDDVDIVFQSTVLADNDIGAIKLADDIKVVCASPSYLSRYGLPTHPSELKLHNCITFSGKQHWTFQVETNLHNIKASGSLSIDHDEAIRDASVEGMGISINSTWSVYQHLANGELIQVLSNYSLTPDSFIYMTYSKHRQLTPKIRAFIDFAKDYIGETPYWDEIVTNSGRLMR
ncbi:LysR family transcriptional regulator [Alteromonas sediminis]|uniref:LysR family transcriptional regulator n=1 Tax=Alteromonas sediminis TaxID=2259342 RepID=A0A3N5Y7B4_9ALTE|nr:LysR family transcriptional regulator [Alteromonas sediminis]RPJ66639.1 LysR family transcriptional regulator [Alteromonas sediminis]